MSLSVFLSRSMEYGMYGFQFASLFTNFWTYRRLTSSRICVSGEIIAWIFTKNVSVISIEAVRGILRADNGRYFGG